MKTTLMSNWTEHDAALTDLLGQGSSEICIFDYDLSRLGLDRSERHELLRTFLLHRPSSRLRIVIQSGKHVFSENPRLARLLAMCGHNFELAQAAEHLGRLTDSLLIVDSRHALIRFHREHVRCKIIMNNQEETTPYRRRFEDIWEEGASLMSPHPAGL